MNRWSTPGVVCDVEQQTGEYGVDWEASAAQASTSEAGSKDETKGQQEDYVYRGRLPEEVAAWVEWFRENDIDIENGVEIDVPPSTDNGEKDSPSVVLLRPE
jgi:hypothetical protein